MAGSLGKCRTVLFLRDGQPKSVCCIWATGGRIYHEFGVLTRETLRGELTNRRFGALKKPAKYSSRSQIVIHRRGTGEHACYK